MLPSSGKLDKKALPSITATCNSASQLFTSSSSSEGAEERSIPVSETEKHLHSVFSEILQMDFIDVQESFFDLGGWVMLYVKSFLISVLHSHQH